MIRATRSPLRGRRRCAPTLSRIASRCSARTGGSSSILHIPDKAKGPTMWSLLLYWRRGRDSNPRYGITVYTLSRRAPSTTRTPLRFFTTSLPCLTGWGVSGSADPCRVGRKRARVNQNPRGFKLNRRPCAEDRSARNLPRPVSPLRRG
jgi:hypothetical protein